MRSQPSRNSSAVASGLLVVARGHRGARDLQLADVALGQDLAGARCRRCASPGPAPACPAGPGGGRSAASASTGLARCWCSSVSASTVSKTRPRMGGGNEPPMASSAMPKAGNTASGRKPWRDGFGDEGLDRVGVDGLGAVEGDAHARQVEALHPLERPCGQHPGEVRPGGGRAAEVGDPLHPAAGVGEEVLRRGLHEVGAARHGQGEQADQPHVVVQRQPRDGHVVGGVDLAGLGDGVEVRAQHPVGQHHALGLGRGAAGVLQDHQPLGVGLGDLDAVRPGAARARAARRRAAPWAGRPGCSS